MIFFYIFIFFIVIKMMLCLVISVVRFSDDMVYVFDFCFGMVESIELGREC